MNAYIFVAATVFSVIPLLIIITVCVNKLIADPKQALQIQKYFFISVALSKILPVVLLIFGIMKLTQVDDISMLYLPWLLIISLVGFGLFYITKQKNLDVSDESKIAILTLISIARPLLFSIPFMAIAFIFLMTR